VKKGWRLSTWGDEISLEYGKAIRGYQEAVAPYRVFGSNGPIGWTEIPLAEGPGIILGRKGAYRGVHFSAEPFFVIDTAYYVRPKTEYDMRWLYYAIIHHQLGQIDDGSPIPSTTRAAVYVREIEVPPLSEQQAIAATLGALDDKIELNRRMNATLEAMARALFRDWFVDFGPTRTKQEGGAPTLSPDLWSLFPDRLDENGIPNGWEMAPLASKFDLLMGQSPPGSTYNDDGDGLPFFQGRTDFGFRFPKNRKYCSAPKRIAKPGDTLVSVRAPVGDINMAAEECCIGRGVASLLHKSGAKSFTYYSAHALQSEIQQYEHSGTVFGAINKRQFEAIITLDPGERLIATFEAIAGTLDQRVALNERESRTLAKTRDLLLPRLMSGELRVREAEEMVEAAE